jgi:hypothetical protein
MVASPVAEFARFSLETAESLFDRLGARLATGVVACLERLVRVGRQAAARRSTTARGGCDALLLGGEDGPARAQD